MNANTKIDRKIIHIDMDCFYAAVEIRDNPKLIGKPVAVGGNANERGVLCTCNYIARKYGVRSAMPTMTALRLCKDLVLLPVNMAKYKSVSRQIQALFYEFTDLVEPLSLDEAYLDVTGSSDFSGSATLIAEEIRRRIWKEFQLTASAGVATNKYLAKIASAYNKPNGIFVITPMDTESFVAKLPVNKLFGVGLVNALKLEKMNIKNCSDLRQYTLTELINRFGKLGHNLYFQARGIDNRNVEPNRIRKSLSVERTFATNISDFNYAKDFIFQLFEQLKKRLSEALVGLPVKAAFIKIKYSDFKHVTKEMATKEIGVEIFLDLFVNAVTRYNPHIA